ncbi:MAG: hypothetical protein KGZ59_07635 [Chitinophagaceae bacterium]|nr:hypothetical protein [Chitinophagaceae bacterium]
MRKSLWFFVLIFSSQIAAQTFPITSINISLPNSPNANTANWSTGSSLVMITANARMVNGKIDDRVRDGKILVVIKKNGAKVCGLNSPNSAPSANFNSSTKVWSGANATSLLAQECTLPAGDYELCVQFFADAGAAPMPISEEKRKLFTIKDVDQINYQSPQNLSPIDGFSISESDIKKPITFRWTPVVPKPQEPVTYRLRVWQLMQGQTSSQALKTNQPIITKDVENITQAIVTNIISGPCKPPYLCDFIWNVQAINKEGKSLGNNDGTSAASTFKIGEENKKKKSTDTTGNQKTIPPNPTDTGKAAIGDTIRAGQDGEFKVIVTDVTVEADGSLTGKGTVRIPWLKACVSVEFKKIRVDTTRRLTLGGIVTTESGSSAGSYLDYPKAWAMSLISGPGVANPLDASMNWSNNLITNLVSWVNDVAPGKQPLIPYNDTIPTPALPNNCLKMPFGLVFKKPEDMLVITEIIFKPNESKINFLAQKLFSKGVTDYKLGFAGKYFKIHPHKIEFGSGRVELAEDINVPNLTSNPKMTFTFKKGAPQAGCYIEWDSTGVKDIGLGLDVKFTRDWLVPVPLTPDSVKATIAGNGTSLSDIILTGSLSQCKIVGTNGVKLQVDSIALDLSDLRSPTSMHFPANYINDTTPQGRLLWQGLYIKKFNLTLPDTWKTGANPTQIIANNCIIDDQGVTMKIVATNIITFPMGRVSDMSASLDTLDLSILKGSLTSGNAKGKLVLPISKDTITNTLKYTATFAQAQASNSLQIVIVPSGPIDADVLRGKMTLSPTSNISASLTDTAKSMSITLNGKFDWGNKDFSVTDTATNTGAAPIRKKGIKGIKMELDFENVSLVYSNNSVTDVQKLTFSPGTWSFASPQKLLANFPVTIKKVYYKSLTTVPPTNTNNRELLRGALMIDVVANLTDDIGGKTTLGGAFAIEQSKSNFFKFSPKFKGVFIEDIEVHADMPAVKIDGNLKMYDYDAVYGDGFLATLGVTFTAVSLQVNALVQFGNTVYNNNNQYYRYWRVEADAKFQPGIPFLTGVGFYGFGGGAFYNMEANLVTRTAPEVGFKYVFKPKKSSLGFVAKATIATLPKFETFNADVALLAQFTTSGGITKIGFTGDFWLAAKLEERVDSKIKGGVVVEYNFTDKIFYMAALLSVNVPPAITTPSPVGFVMNINGTTNKWYFKAGTPSATNTVRIFGIDLYSYLMFGNDIPVPTGFTPRFANNYYAATGSWPNNGNVGSGGVGTNTATGKGIAAGLGIEFSQNITKNLYKGTCRQWAISGDVMAGAELNLAFMHQTGCIGINGYRASGNIGLYGSVNATITGTSFKNVCDNKSINLFKIQTGAWLTGKFPNPEYVAGALSANIDLFGGLCQISYSQNFQKGTDCSGTAVVTADAPQEDEAADLVNKLIQSVAPTTRYNFPITSPINVRYGLVPDRSFDVAENQGDGTIKNRTFKLKVVATLEVKNASGAWVAQTIHSKVNNLGEFQYYKKPPLNVNNATIQVSQASQMNMVNTNNANSMVSMSGAIKNNLIVNPVPPPPPPNYPNPVPDVVNNLEVDKDYRFIVTATLMEYGPNEVANTGVAAGKGTGFHTEVSWFPAKTRTNQIVTETKTVLLRTGPMQIFQANANNQVK